jgi:hypothetical protein
MREGVRHKIIEIDAHRARPKDDLGTECPRLEPELRKVDIEADENRYVAEVEVPSLHTDLRGVDA